MATLAKEIPDDIGIAATAQWLRQHVAYCEEDCLIWPFSRSEQGYATISIKNRLYKASRVMCQLVHGTPPELKYEAAHSCGRGKFGCVNPKHLTWKTASDNQRDRIAHGRRPNGGTGRSGTLTPEQVLEIRRSDKTQAELAAEYGTSWQNIRLILRRETWAHLPDENNISHK